MIGLIGLLVNGEIFLIVIKPRDVKFSGLKVELSIGLWFIVLANDTFHLAATSIKSLSFKAHNSVNTRLMNSEVYLQIGILTVFME